MLRLGVKDLLQFNSFKAARAALGWRIGVYLRDRMPTTKDTLLHRLIAYSPKPTQEVAYRYWLKILIPLLAHSQNVRGQRPLHVAALCNNPVAVRLLLLTHVDTNLLDINSNTALDLATPGSFASTLIRLYQKNKNAFFKRKPPLGLRRAFFLGDWLYRLLYCLTLLKQGAAFRRRIKRLFAFERPVPLYRDHNDTYESHLHHQTFSERLCPITEEERLKRKLVALELSLVDIIFFDNDYLNPKLYHWWTTSRHPFTAIHFSLSPMSLLDKEHPSVQELLPLLKRYNFLLNNYHKILQSEAPNNVFKLPTLSEHASQ